eukprot:SAG11_NODE_4495_length_1875_cov_0.964527_2_plen_86_part_00
MCFAGLHGRACVFYSAVLCNAHDGSESRKRLQASGVVQCNDGPLSHGGAVDEEEDDDNDEDEPCAVCLTNRRDALSVSCGHVVRL